jgi:hypothetical protein
MMSECAFRVWLILLLVIAVCLEVAGFVAYGQQNQTFPQKLYYASDYGTWDVVGQVPNTYIFSPPGVCTIPAPDAPAFVPWNTNAPVFIRDSNSALSEVVTPSSIVATASFCGIIGTTAHSHTSYDLLSGTGGLQEVLNQIAGTIPYPVQVILDRNWYTLVHSVPGQTAAGVIAAAKGSTAATLVDNTTAPETYYTWNGSVYVAASGGSSLLSQKVVYTSKLAGTTGGVAVVPGSSATSTTDSSTALNTAIAGGNVDLEVDSGYALSTSLVLSSNTTIHCIAPQYGFIMQTAANAPVLANAHQNAPTTASGTGGYLPSNITDVNITVRGCQINDNATQSVTGTCVGGPAHNATPGGLYVNAVQFVGAQGLTFDSNEVYDPGTYLTFFSNVLDTRVTNNYVHVPTPQVASKGTDGVHFIGPASFLWVQNNHITAGDDSIALNADDGNRAGSGAPNISCAQWPGVKNGPILHGHIDHNSLDSTFYGLRLLSATELIDDIEVTDLAGTACGNTGTLQALWAGTLGSGKLGRILIDGWTVQTDGTCNTFSLPYNFLVSENPADLEINNLRISNPAVTWPVYTETSTAPGIRSFHNWDLVTQSSTFSNVFALNGNTGDQVTASGMNWLDSIGTGSFFSGSQPPQTITASNYAGPPRLLAAGFAPTNQNGDAFTNTYTTTTTYISTIFNEGAAAAALIGTAPATCINGCTGNWTASAGYPSSNVWQFGTGGLSGAGACSSGSFCAAYVDAGVSNYTMRVGYSSTTPNDSIAFYTRYTDQNNNVFIACSAGVMDIYDIVSGTATLKNSGGTCANGNYTIVMAGTSVTLTTPGGAVSATISGSNTATNVGVGNYGSGATLRITLASLSVKSN